MLLTPLFALVFPLFAQQGTTAPPPATPPETPSDTSDVVVTAPERPICRERGEDVGSNIRRRQRVCITAEQAEQERAAAVEAQASLNTALGQASYAARAAAGGEGPAPVTMPTP